MANMGEEDFSSSMSGGTYFGEDDIVRLDNDFGWAE
jgi:hypothetical protein